MAIDPFPAHSQVPGGPASHAFAIVPGPGNLSRIPSAIYVGNGGNVALKPYRSPDPVIYRNVPSGAYLTVRASAVLANGTTATDLIGEY